MSLMKRYRFLFLGQALLLGGLVSLALSTPQDQTIPWDTPIQISPGVHPLRQILKEISRQAGVFFVFSDALVEGRDIALPSQGEPLKQVMRLLLRDSNLGFQVRPPDIIVLYQLVLPPGVPEAKEVLPVPFTPIPLVPPQLLTVEQPPYPPAALTQGLEGPVNMNLLVNKLGKVDRVELVTTSGHAILDQAGMRFAKTLVFKPARQGDKPVDTWINHVLEFRLVQREQLPEIQAQILLSLQIQLADSQLQGRETILKEYVEKVIQFTRLEEAWPPDRINAQVVLLVRPELLRPWLDYKTSHPLGFLLLHQYLQVYAPPGGNQTVQDRLSACVYAFVVAKKGDAKPRGSVELDRRFRRALKGFLAAHYPQILAI